MYPHHEKAITQLEDYFKKIDGVIAIILGGSVAKGKERVDSDIDAVLIVTPELYKIKKEQNALAECIHGICEYEGGYFDVKYFTKDYLTDAADHGSEPARNAYICGKVLFTTDEEIYELVEAIPVFQKQEKQEKIAVFYSSLMLNHHYFWQLKDESLYLKVRTATEIVYAAYRIILQENEIIFPCNRRLEGAVIEAPLKPDNIVQLAASFLEKLDDQSELEFVESIINWTSYKPDNDTVSQSKYVEYFELWWKNPRPFVNEW